MKTKIFTTFIAMVILSSCGFRLGGSTAGYVSLHPSLAYVHISGGGTSFQRLMYERLEGSGIKLVTSSYTDNHAVIKFNTFSSTAKVISVTESTQAREYRLESELNMTVLKKEKGVELETCKSCILLPPTHLKVQRDFVFSATSILSSGAEQQRLYKEMEEELARLVMYKLKTVNSESKEE
jgi:outer membrane lipopolysaccharide assembly protein LptE/RlpB